METKLSVKSFLIGRLAKSFLLIALLAACSEQQVEPVRPVDPVETLTAEDLKGSSNARQFCNPSGPNYNLNVILRGDKRAFGFIKFRQYENETQLIHLDTWVSGLQPNTTYLLQRAVDTMLDGNCTSTAWLTLGKGLDPQSILTNNRGAGMENLWRSVASIPVGSTFDIHFQIIKESTSEVVLTSDCLQYTVR